MGNRGIVAPAKVLTTTLETAWTVPAGKEWRCATMRACNVSAASPPVNSTVTVTINGGRVGFNWPVKVGEAVNVFGPDTCWLPAGTVIAGRSGTADTIELTGFFDERDVP